MPSGRKKSTNPRAPIHCPCHCDVLAFIFSYLAIDEYAQGPSLFQSRGQWPRNVIVCDTEIRCHDGDCAEGPPAQGEVSRLGAFAVVCGRRVGSLFFADARCTVPRSYFSFYAWHRHRRIWGLCMMLTRLGSQYQENTPRRSLQGDDV